MGVSPAILYSLPFSYQLITQEECTALNELYNYNPLLFDVACKRLLRGPNGERFPTSVFKTHPSLPPFRPPIPTLGTGAATGGSCTTGSSISTEV